MYSPGPGSVELACSLANSSDARVLTVAHGRVSGSYIGMCNFIVLSFLTVKSSGSDPVLNGSRALRFS